MYTIQSFFFIVFFCVENTELLAIKFLCLEFVLTCPFHPFKHRRKKERERDKRGKEKILKEEEKKIVRNEEEERDRNSAP